MQISLYADIVVFINEMITDGYKMKFFQKEQKILKYLLIGIMGIFLIIPIHSFGLDNGYARIVYNVSGLQDYQLHWNDRFPPDSILMIYVEADGINHRREAGIDYIIVIRDSNDNIINHTIFNNRYHDYRVNDFIKYSQKIDEGWEDGAYTAEIHIFDLLNDSIMAQYYAEFFPALLNVENCRREENVDRNRRRFNICEKEEDKLEIPYMDVTNIINDTELNARQYRKVIQNFYIDKYANKYPTNRFMIENISLYPYSVSPGVDILVNITIKNNFYDNGSASVDLILDNETVGNTTIFTDPYSSKEVTLAVPTLDLDYGSHILEVIPTSDNTIGFDLLANFNVVESGIEVPIRLQYRDIQTDKMAIRPNETINITVTVENKGRTGTQNVGLLINNVPIEEKSVRLNSSEIRDINFTVSETEIGEYRITINNTNISKIFFVETEGAITGTPVEKPVEERQIPKVFIILVLSILVVIIYIIRRRIISKQKEEEKEEKGEII